MWFTGLQLCLQQHWSKPTDELVFRVTSSTHRLLYVCILSFCVDVDSPHLKSACAVTRYSSLSDTRDFEPHPCFTQNCIRDVLSRVLSAPCLLGQNIFKVISLEQKRSHLKEVMVRFITILSIIMLVRSIGSSSWCFHFNLCQKKKKTLSL